MDNLFTEIEESDLQSIKDRIIAEPQLLNGADNRGLTPLMHAVSHYNRNVEVVKLLLDYGANVNASAIDGSSVLHCAIDVDFAANDNTNDIISMLVQAGADLEKRQCYGWTPLMKAVVLGTLEEIKALLSLGADPNKIIPFETMPAFNSGRTTLMAALVQPDNELIISSLLQSGADPLALDSHNMEFFEYAKLVMSEIGNENKDMLASIERCIEYAQNYLRKKQA